MYVGMDRVVMAVLVLNHGVGSGFVRLDLMLVVLKPVPPVLLDGEGMISVDEEFVYGVDTGA
jgi:hypothetical protein